MGVGALGFGAAALFFVLRNGATGRLEMQCDRTGASFQCDNTPETQGQLGQAVTFNALTNVGFVVGGLGVGAGLVWLLVGGRGGGSAERPRAMLVPHGDGLMLTIGGVL